MTEAPRISRAALAAAKSVGESEYLNDIVIGRDVLELVSSAMYVDPMTVYREYVQNAADAIDDARARNLLMPDLPGEVTITIDQMQRTIRIRDNGAGLTNAEFARRMPALGASSKRGTSARGFRGVGRLAGLGYAQELIFRSRRSAEEPVAELSWDCRKLKALLRQEDGDIESLIRSVATLRKRHVSEDPDRFFEVELRGVVRLRSDRLMNPAAVEEYLGQVAPVPFSPEFRFADEIRAALAPMVELGELHIRINDNEAPVYRPHRDVFVQEGGKATRIDALSIAEIPGIDGDIAAIAWILHHDYEGALPNAWGTKGLRLRCGNVQIGEHGLLEDLFPETRFNSWAIGEIHIIDRKIVPNGRRDHFEQSAHYHNLTNQLAPIARDIAHRCRTSSIKRNWIREIETHSRMVEETVDILQQGVLGPDEYGKKLVAAEEGLRRTHRALSQKIFSETEVCSYREDVTRLENRVASLAGQLVPEQLQAFPERDREVFMRICEVIYQVSTSQSSAKALIDKIMAKLEIDYGATGKGSPG